MAIRDRLKATLASDGTSALGGGALLLALVLFSVVAGVPGAIVGLGLVVAWLLLPDIVVFVLGQVALVSLLPAATASISVVLLEIPLVVLLLGVESNSSRFLRTVAVTTLALALFGGLTLLGVQSFAALWQASVLLVFAAAATAYGLHRYSVVVFSYPNEF